MYIPTCWLQNMCYWNFKVSLKGPFGLITRTHCGNLKLQSWTKTKSLKNEESFAMKTSDTSFYIKQFSLGVNISVWIDKICRSMRFCTRNLMLISEIWDKFTELFLKIIFFKSLKGSKVDFKISKTEKD